MPLSKAKKILKDENATLEQLHNCIAEINREIGHLSCRSNSEPQLIPNLTELEQTLAKLEERYSNNKPKDEEIDDSDDSLNDE